MVSSDSSARHQPEVDSVKVGYIRRAHGIKGAVIVRVLGNEDDQYVAGRVLLSDDSHHPELTVDRAHPHKDGLLVEFQEVADRNLAEALAGTSLHILAAERRELDPDEFWPEQLLGLPVCDPDQNRLGEVVDLISGGSQDRLVVAAGDATVEVPFVKAIVTTVDLDTGIVVVDAPAGLFPD